MCPYVFHTATCHKTVEGTDNVENGKTARSYKIQVVGNDLLATIQYHVQ